MITQLDNAILFRYGAAGSVGATFTPTYSGNITSGKWMIGSSATATSQLQIAAGTASANTSPLKFTLASAVKNTTPERGAVEVEGNRMFYTDSTGTRYIIHAGGTPTISAGAGAGTSPTISIAGIDECGYISLTTGTSPSTSSTVATITFSITYGVVPKCVLITPANAAAAELMGTGFVYVNQSGISATSWSISVGSTALDATTDYKWYFRVMQ